MKGLKFRFEKFGKHNVLLSALMVLRLSLPRRKGRLHGTWKYLKNGWRLMPLKSWRRPGRMYARFREPAPPVALEGP